MKRAIHRRRRDRVGRVPAPGRRQGHCDRRLRRGAHRRSLHRRLHHEQRSRNHGQAGGARVEGRSRQLQRHRASTACRSSRPSPATAISACTEMGGAEGRPSARRSSSTQRANPAQQLALVAMANELSKGLVGTIVQVTAAPIQFTDHGSEIQVSAGQVALDVNKHIDARPDLRRDAVVPPARVGRRCDDGRGRAARVHRLVARHQVERPEQALGVLRHVQLLDARQAGR